MSVPREYILAEMEAEKVGARYPTKESSKALEKPTASLSCSVGTPMSVLTEDAPAKMKAGESRARAKAAKAPSGKRYYAPSRNRNAPSAPLFGTPMAVPAEYVLAKMQAEKSHASCTATPATRERPSSTLSRTSNASSVPALGTPMAIPVEYRWAKEQEKKSREPSLTSGASESRYSEETT